MDRFIVGDNVNHNGLRYRVIAVKDGYLWIKADDEYAGRVVAQQNVIPIPHVRVGDIVGWDTKCNYVVMAIDVDRVWIKSIPSPHQYYSVRFSDLKVIEEKHP